MKTYPEVPRDERYRTEQARHLDSPFRLAVFEALWSGTEQMQAVIQRDGAAHYQQQLGLLRVQSRQLDLEIPALEKAGQIFDGQAETRKTQARKLATETHTFRDHNGRRQIADNSAQVAKLVNQSMKDLGLAKHCTLGVADKRGIQLMFRDADERLTAALVMFMDRAAVRAVEPPPPPPAPPVINVNVAAPEVHLEATIDCPPAEVSINLPPRRTIGTIERDRSGNIVRTEQVETDLEDAA